MQQTQKPEEKIADALHKFLRIVGLSEVPEALVRQVSYRLGVKPNRNPEKDLRKALGAMNVIPSSNYKYPTDMIEFDVHDVGLGGSDGISVVTLNPSFNFDGHTITFSQVSKDLFTVVEDVLFVVLGKPAGQNVRTTAGFQLMHKTIEEFLEGFRSGKFSDSDKHVNYFKNICNGARDKILGREPVVNTGNVIKYQKYLRKENALAPFSALGSLTALAETRLLFEIPFLADKAIAMISGNGGFSYEESVAIYNARFGCAYEPYTGVIVVCAECCKANSFYSGVRNTEKCTGCGKPLFRKCGSDGCGASVPRTSDTCPQCGARESDVKHCNEIITAAKNLADKGYMEKAEEYLICAQAAAPNRTADYKSIQAKIDAVKASRRKIIDEIDDLMTARLCYAAQKKLAEAKRILPPGMLAASEERITGAIRNAEKLFSSAGDNAAQLQKVLAICADHTEAKMYMDRIPPKAPANLGAPFVNSDSHIQLSWSPSPDIDVTYQVVRKTGSAPVSVSDGLLIAETDKLESIDKAPAPGVVYYGVFAKRGKRYSPECAYNFIKHLPAVADFTMKFLRGKGVELAYKIPGGAVNVTISRESSGGKSDLIYEGSKTAMLDPSAQGKCTYIIKAVYNENMESAPKKLFFDADAIPKEIKPLLNAADNNVVISWETKQKGFFVKVIDARVGSSSLEEGGFYSENELGAKSQELTSVRSEDAGTSFRVDTNRQYNLAVLIGDKNGYLCCGTFPYYYREFPKLQRAPKDVSVDGTHEFVFEHALPERDILYAVCKQNTPPSNDRFRPERIIPDRDGKHTLRIQNLNYQYVGQYYVFCKFKLEDGNWSAPVSSRVHFRQEIRIVFKLSQRGTTLTGNLSVDLMNYDFEGYPELPDLLLKVDGNDYPIGKTDVTIRKRSFKKPIQIQTLAPVRDLSRATLTPADRTFLSDFRMISKSQEV